ncbi:related to 6-HYDROXY-D-NICOTINE OXIDASE [Phialocephala subalpina]|uniref:Related to 6-HYDROXY-D-NICOTINE OXIDASE n=1 Tax=Phialocephala subalpina TaxID=576137 RepID=A0A1L7XLR5_9HELO|nr:related to 6-HYDROXY-D-NICOTINE OXIDASE [Phialocephala subalpina]
MKLKILAPLSLAFIGRCSAGGNPTCCQQLTSVFPALVYFPNSTAYSASLGEYFTEQEFSITPTCFFHPFTPAEIATALPILSASNCPFAVKSGGHGIWGGLANIQDGVSIDLAEFNGVDVDGGEQGTVARVGVGMKWGDVYDFLGARGLAVVGGRWGSVGVGGLILGGGISFFSTRKGFACDTVVNHQIVLATGEIINANATSNPELWQALKGGSNNFGIVTRVDLLAFPQGDFWGGLIINPFSEEAFEHFTNALHIFSSDPEYDENASLIFTYNFDSSTRTWIIISNVQYTSIAGYPSNLEPFTSYEPQLINTMRVSNLSDFAITNSEGEEEGTTRSLYFTRTYVSSEVLIRQIFEIFNSTVYNTLSIIEEDVTWGITAEPFPPILTQYGKLNGGNILGLDPSDGPLILFLATVTWHDSVNDLPITQAIETYFSQIDTLSKSLGLYNEYSYLNYAYKDQKVMKGYGKENLQQMKSLSKQFDPEGVFQRLVPGGFKLDD